MCFNTKLLLVMVLLFSFFIAQNTVAQGKIEKLIATGSGLSEEKAIQNTNKTAIQQVVGMYVVSDAVMKNRELIKDEVLSQSNAYIKSFKVLNKSKDADGLFEIEAEVEVEVGKLTNKLGELNIAVKKVGTEEFVAVSLDKFDASEDFKAMAERIIFQPLRENKKVYDIKIKNLTPLDDYTEKIHWLSDKSKELAEIGEIKPFRVEFNIKFNNDYINLVTQFMEKASKQVFDFFKKGENNVYIVEIILGNQSNIMDKQSIVLDKKVLKSYELTSSNYNIYKILHLKHCETYQPILVISLLGDDDSPVIQSSYYFEFRGGGVARLSQKCCSVGPLNTLNMSTFVMRTADSNIWRSYRGDGRSVNDYNIVTGLDDEAGIEHGMQGYKHPEGFFKNTQDLSFVMFLSKDDVKKTKNLKIELMWLEYGKITKS